MSYFDKFNEGEVVSLKMVSGEEVIARIVRRDEDGLIVIQPASLAQTPDGKFTLTPFAMIGDLDAESLIFSKTIMLMSRPRKEMEENYNKATSKLHIPTPSKILLG